MPATDELVVYCDHHDIPFVPFSPLLKGAYGRDDRPIPDEYVNTENRLKMRTVERLAAEHDVSGNQLVLAWMTQRDPPAIPLFGCSSVDQLEENLDSLSVDLSETDLDRLNETDRLGAINY